MKSITELGIRLTTLGHRNWVLLVDSAYPEQCAPGVETIVTVGPHLSVLQTVVQAFQRAPHIRPVACLDAEIEWLDDNQIAGVEALRSSMQRALQDFEVEMIPHEELLAVLSDAASMYKVIVIKTQCMIPYSSIFFRLECGYWDEAHELALRERMNS